MSLEPEVVASYAVRTDALPPPFACSCTKGGLDAAWVHVGGELDIVTTPELVRTLAASQAQARLVVLDLRELEFIDSCGTHAIVGATGRARQAGGRLVLVRVPPNVDRMLQVTGSAGDLEISDVHALAPPLHAVQRSLVSQSLMMADKTHRNGGRAR